MTLRDPNAFWVAPLLARGAAATLGNVYEPYLQFTAHLNIFNDRLLHGFTFAESAYSSIDVLSWTSVMVGDPLYRPYASWLQLEVSADSGKTDSWKMYHDFAVQNFSSASAQYRSLARQAASRARNCPMIEDLGLMEAADGNLLSATNYFGQARTCYSNRDDILRVVIEEADAWKNWANRNARLICCEARFELPVTRRRRRCSEVSNRSCAGSPPHRARAQSPRRE